MNLATEDRLIYKVHLICLSGCLISMKMSLQEVYDNPEVSKMEEKFALVRKSDTEFEGKYPLENFREDARGIFGGEFVAQSLNAAWETVEDPEFQVHSLHSYFLKAGSTQSVMKYEVTPTSQGRNYCSRLVKAYQLHNNLLCFIEMVSFTRKNDIQQRKVDYAALSDQEKFHPRTKVPFEFSRKPHYTFDKYINKLDNMSVFTHTNGNVSLVFPKETMKATEQQKKEDPGLRQFSMFMKVNDNVDVAKNNLRARMMDFAFLSDLTYLSTILRTVLDEWSNKSMDFFRVSLDHTVHIHDTNFDPTEWLFLDYRFVRMSNDRVLVTVSFFTPDKRLVATVLQEALALIPLSTLEKTRGGSYKL